MLIAVSEIQSEPGENVIMNWLILWHKYVEESTVIQTSKLAIVTLAALLLHRCRL